MFFAVALAIAATTTILPALGMWIATIRFLLDFMSGATMLATVGCLAAWERTVCVRLLTAGPIVELATYSVALGMLLGFSGYSAHFQRHNPTLYQRLRQEVSLCQK